MADATARFVLTAEDRTARAFASADRGLKQLQRSVTGMRSLMTGFGVVLSGRALLGWITNATKAADATGEHAKQIKAAQDAMAGFKKASDDLAVSIGVSLTPAIQALGNVVTGLNAAFFNADPAEFGKQIEDTRDRIVALQNQMTQPRAMAMRGAEIRAEYERLNKVLDELISKQRRALGLDMGPEFRQNVGIKNAAAGMHRIGDTVDRFGHIRGALGDGVMRRPDVNLDVLDEFEEIVVTAREMTVDELMKPFPAAEVEKLFKPVKDEGLQAAEFLGSSFRGAFDSWIMDTDRNFKDLLRRMAINAATSALFQGLGTLFGGMGGTTGAFFSSFFGGSRASGGSTRAGMVYKVHPGEAFFTPGMDGHVAGAGAGGPNVTITNHIDARGADQSLVSRLPEILERNSEQTMAKVRDLIRRRRF